MGKCIHDLNKDNHTLKIVNKRVLVYPQVYDCFCTECSKIFKFKLDDDEKFHRINKRSSAKQEENETEKTEKEDTNLSE